METAGKVTGSVVLGEEMISVVVGEEEVGTAGVVTGSVTLGEEMGVDVGTDGVVTGSVTVGEEMGPVLVDPLVLGVSVVTTFVTTGVVGEIVDAGEVTGSVTASPMDVLPLGMEAGTELGPPLAEIVDEETEPGEVEIPALPVGAVVVRTNVGVGALAPLLIGGLGSTVGVVTTETTTEVEVTTRVDVVMGMATSEGLGHTHAWGSANATAKDEASSKNCTRMMKQTSDDSKERGWSDKGPVEEKTND